MTEKNRALEMQRRLARTLAIHRDANREAQEGDRGPLYKALWTISSFIDQSEQLQGQGFEEPFLKLLVAFSELDRGITPPLLEAAKRKGRPLKARRQEFIEVSAASMVSTLMKLGLSWREAAKEVCVPLLKNGLLQGRIGTKTIDPVDRILSWREDLELGPKTGDAHAIDSVNIMYQDFKKKLSIACENLQSEILAGRSNRAEAVARLMEHLDIITANRNRLF